MAPVTSVHVAVRLAQSEVALLIESLDSHEYWQIGDELPRKNGEVFIPGDMEPDLIWADAEPTAAQRAAIGELAAPQDHADRLRVLLDDGESATG